MVALAAPVHDAFQRARLVTPYSLSSQSALSSSCLSLTGTLAEVTQYWFYLPVHTIQSSIFLVWSIFLPGSRSRIRSRDMSAQAGMMMVTSSSGAQAGAPQAASSASALSRRAHSRVNRKHARASRSRAPPGVNGSSSSSGGSVQCNATPNSQIFGPELESSQIANTAQSLGPARYAAASRPSSAPRGPCR